MAMQNGGPRYCTVPTYLCSSWLFSSWGRIQRLSHNCHNNGRNGLWEGKKIYLHVLKGPCLNWNLLRYLADKFSSQRTSIDFFFYKYLHMLIKDIPVFFVRGNVVGCCKFYLALPASLLRIGVVLPSSYDVGYPPCPIGLRLVIGRP